MKKGIYIICISFIITSLLSHLIHHLLIVYSEKTSWIWNIVNSRDIENSNYDILILGDSQIMSGIRTELLEKTTGKKILFYPRPSEQPEGILLLLNYFVNKNIQYKKLIVNISPVTVSKNIITDSHKNLVINFDRFRLELLTDSFLNRFYLKDFGTSFYYIFIQFFPLVKLNQNIGGEFRLLDLSSQSKNIEELILNKSGKSFSEREKLNRFLSNELQKNNYYWEWGKETPYSGVCNLSETVSDLPSGIGLAFARERKEAILSWKKIGNFAIENGKQIYFVYAPFREDTESAIFSESPELPIQIALKELEASFPGKIIRVPKDLFAKNEFADYTHLNSCGMEKLTYFVSEFLK